MNQDQKMLFRSETLLQGHKHQQEWGMAALGATLGQVTFLDPSDQSGFRHKYHVI